MIFAYDADARMLICPHPQNPQAHIAIPIDVLRQTLVVPAGVPPQFGEETALEDGPDGMRNPVRMIRGWKVDEVAMHRLPRFKIGPGARGQGNGR